MMLNATVKKQPMNLNFGDILKAVTVIKIF